MKSYRDKNPFTFIVGGFFSFILKGKKIKDNKNIFYTIIF